VEVDDRHLNDFVAACAGGGGGVYVGVRPFRRGGRRAGPSSGAPLGARPTRARVACSRSPIYAFTMPIRVFTMDRSRRSRCSDAGVHVRPILVFTLGRNPQPPPR
jgi:hypothetical protein